MYAAPGSAEPPAPARPGITAASRGVWLMGADVDFARRVARSGFDWVCLDAQHGAIDRASLMELGRMLGDIGANFVVRVPGVEQTAIGAALDAGAAGVIVPSVTSIADAEQVVRATYYTPLGQRSWGPFASLWDRQAPDAASANAAAQCAVMIETAGALDDVEQIAALDGVSCLFLGPVDLSLALGRDLDDVLADHAPGAPIPRIVAAAAASGRTVAAFAGDPSRVNALRAHGIRAIAVATDIALTDLGARAVLDLTAE